MTVAERPSMPEVPLHRALGVTDEELDAIRDRLGRDPNDLELAMFSVAADPAHGRRGRRRGTGRERGGHLDR